MKSPKELAIGIDRYVCTKCYGISQCKECREADTKSIELALIEYGKQVREECAKVASEYHYGRMGMVSVQQASDEISKAIRDMEIK